MLRETIYSSQSFSNPERRRIGSLKPSFLKSSASSGSERPHPQIPSSLRTLAIGKRPCP